MKHCVIFENGKNPLYLTDVKLNKDGTVKSGWVVNGAWNYEVRKGECLAKAGNTIVTRWPKSDKDIVVPVEKYSSDYNKVIEDAWSKVNG